ncbi:MAG TPA: hypothetical protein VMU49_09065 [Candidatus Acidoferrales bacterium]|nr:hypothetical protein [Candidatus Acidoferrales bacterium]
MGRQPLLIFFAPADHPHRDAACATLSWLAAAEGRHFECYFDSPRSGTHFGGGAPWRASLADLRGGTFNGGHHLEQLLLLTSHFSCQAAVLGDTVFAGPLSDLGVPVRAHSEDIASFYREMFSSGPTPWPETLLVIGHGRSPATSLVPYACQEVAARRLLAISEGDANALERLSPGIRVEALWVAAQEVPGGQGDALSEQTASMAERWAEHTNRFLLGDSEMVARWVPTAIRDGWAPVFSVPQSEVLARLSGPIGATPVVYGRQQDDADFLALSELGVAFQLVDPGRPPFPIVRHAAAAWPKAPPSVGPDDAELHRWAREGRVVVTLLFWAGMIRELECFYALTDVLSVTRMRAGVVLTTESFRYMPRPPLSLIQVAADLGGLAPHVEPLLASAGIGAMIESAAPLERFARTLAESVADLAQALGGADQLPKGWWSVMDAPLLSHKVRAVEIGRTSPYLKLRYPPRKLELSGTAAGAEVAAATNPREALRTIVRDSPLGRFFQPQRPFDDRRPGAAARTVLEAVRAAGFDYALTKASFNEAPSVADVGGLTVLNHTAGRWDGWTPFVTVNNLADLRAAERRLLRARKPGWVLGSLDTCLWAFTGHLWDRGRELRAICEWVAQGGSTGRLINVTPGTAARYAKVLADTGLARTLPTS